MRVKTCRDCQANDPDVAYRPKLRTVLCSACYLDALAGSTKARVDVAPRESQDKYAQMAARHGF